mgnify:CR=1 FL=1
MRRWIFIPSAFLMVVIALCGCAGMGDRVSDFLHGNVWWKADQTEDISRRAKALEAAGELDMALDHWRLIERIAFDRDEARREINRLQATIADAVQNHYHLGIEKMKAGEPDAARIHFLAVLRLDPSFQPALQQIKTGFTPFPLVVYHSQPGDRPCTIAEKVFGDAEKAFLVVWFNDLPKDAKIAPGSLLILPRMGKRAPEKQQKKAPGKHLDEAYARLSTGDVKGALGLAGQLNADDPDVRSLMHAAYLRQAVIQTEAGRLEAAQRSLSMVPDGFRGKDAALEQWHDAAAGRHILEEAKRLLDAHDYRASLDLAAAVLAQAPDNTVACHLADEARYRLARELVDSGRLLMARAVLEKADSGHAPSMALGQTVANRLQALAQKHYRNGVKHFINENLNAAVDEWEEALRYNPNLEKAGEDIDNARRIMQKIESMP